MAKSAAHRLCGRIVSAALLTTTLTHGLRISKHTLLSLSADGTDRLVALVQEEQDAAAARGEEPPLFGAKITGGGGGGERGLPLLLLLCFWRRFVACFACLGGICPAAPAGPATLCVARKVHYHDARNMFSAGTVGILAIAGPAGDAAVQRVVQVCTACSFGCRGIHAWRWAVVSLCWRHEPEHFAGRSAAGKHLLVRSCNPRANATHVSLPRPSASCSDTQQRPAAGRTCSRARLAVQWHLAACACGGEALLQLRRQRTADPNLTCRCNNAPQMNYCKQFNAKGDERRDPKLPESVTSRAQLAAMQLNCQLPVHAFSCCPICHCRRTAGRPIAIAAASRLPARRRLSRRDAPCRVGSSPSPAAPAPAPPACGGQGAPVGRSGAGGQAMWAAGWQCCPALRLQCAAAGRCLPCQVGCGLGWACPFQLAGLTLQSPTASTTASSCAAPAAAPQPRACIRERQARRWVWSAGWCKGCSAGRLPVQLLLPLSKEEGWKQGVGSVGCSKG